MIPVKNKVLVQVNADQKEYAEIGGVKLFLANDFNTNYRERNPVLAYVLQGCNEIEEGSFVVVHHNYFSNPSPYEYTDGIYSIPYGNNIFFVIDKEGNPHSVCNNIVAERIEENEIIGLANPKRQHFHDRVKVVEGIGYESGDEIFTLKFADYETIYNWNGIEKRVIRVHSGHIVAKLKKNVI